MTYVPVTVGRRAGGFTVGRGPATVTTVGRGAAVTFTVTGHPGATGYIDGALLTETGSYLTLESGDLLLTA